MEEDDQSLPVPLTAQQAEEFRRRNPTVSPWRVIGVQVAVGLSSAALAWLFWDAEVAASVVWGASAVVVPALLFARGLFSPLAGVNPGAAVASFMLWEFVKILASVAIMFAAFRWLSGLNAVAMLAGLILTLKVYWLALVFRPSEGVLTGADVADGQR